MNCLDHYRGRLVTSTNKNLRLIHISSEEKAVHDFRVGVKRLTALYLFVHAVKSEIAAKRLLKPYRSLSKSISRIRDAQIALELLADLEGIDSSDRVVLLKALRSRIRKDYRSFQNFAQGCTPARLPTIRAMGLSESTILKTKPLVQDNLLKQILTPARRMNAEQWHKLRILLKRYHHTLDAFHFCPGHTLDESELKQMKILEQLLGDWHDRVICIEILQSFAGLEVASTRAIATMNKQERVLLGSAKIYLAKFAKWHRQR